MELYNPFGYFGGQPDQQQQQTPIPGQPAVPLLQPQEEDSLLSQVTGKALGGLGYVGSTLGKLFGGRAIRGALGGNARELLSVIPFSDMAHITDPSQEVHGEDLLKQWGMLEGEGQKGTFELRDLAGPTLEAALDPGTYLTLGAGALTGAGKAAKMGGTLEKTLAGRIAAGQGGLAGLHVPFTNIGTVVGTGEKAQAVAQKLGSVSDYLSTGNPVGRSVGALFDKSRSLGGKPAMTMEGQRGVQAINEAIPEAKAAASKRVLDIAEQLRDQGGMTPTNAEVRNYAEKTGAANPAQQTAADALQQLMGEQHQEAIALGRPEGTIENHFPRQATPIGDEEAFSGLGRGKVGETGNAHQLHREDIFDLPGQTDFVNRMSVDPNISGPARKIKSASGLAEADYLRGQIPNYDAAELARLRGLPPEQLAPPGIIGKTPEAVRLAELEGIEKKTVGLADWLGKLSGKRTEGAEKLPFFGNNALSDAYSYARSQAETNTTTKGLLKIIADTASTEAGPGSVRLADVIKGMGLTEQANVPLSKQLAEASNKHIAGFLSEGDAYLHNLHVDGKIAEDLLRVKQGFTTPEVLKGPLQAIDSFTNLFRTMTSTIRPSAKVRNLVQGVWSMFTGGHADPRFSGPQSYLQPMLDSVTLLRKGGAIEDASKMPYFAGRGLTDEQASAELNKWMFANGVAGPDKMIRDADVVGQGMHAAQRNLQLPGDVQPTLGEIARSAVPHSMEEAFPTSVAGFAGKTETKFSPAVAAREFDKLSDDATRGGSFIALMRQGYTPEAARLETAKVHLDFTNLSPFEKSVMRRVVPFYNWQRQNLPSVLRQLVEEPSGPTAQAAKLTAASRHEQGFLPDYVGETLAMPIGQEANGTRTFLSHTGLPFEDLNDLGTGAHPIQRTAQNLMAQTNPLIKGPLEAITGMQFRSGRELADLYSRTGSPMFDQVLMNSPASNIINTIGTLSDPRKSWGAAATNLLSPARLSDVNLDAARNKAGRDYIEESLKQNPEVRQFQTLSVPPDKLAGLSPEEYKQLQLLRTLEAQAKKKSQPSNIGIAR